MIRAFTLPLFSCIIVGALSSDSGHLSKLAVFERWMEKSGVALHSNTQLRYSQSMGYHVMAVDYIDPSEVFLFR